MKKNIKINRKQIIRIVVLMLIIITGVSFVSNFKQKKVMLEFDKVSKEGTNEELINFIKDNASSVSKKRANSMANTILDELEKRAYEYTLMFQDGNFSNYSKEELLDYNKMIKAEFKELYLNGYMVCEYETHYEVIRNIALLKKIFRNRLSKEYFEYFDIIEKEGLDAAENGETLRIAREDAADRKVQTERFIDKYKKFYKIDDVKYLDKVLLKVYLYDSLKDVDMKEVRQHYNDTLKKHKGTKLAKILKDYVKLIEKNNDTISNEVTNYIQGIVSNYTN